MAKGLLRPPPDAGWTAEEETEEAAEAEDDCAAGLSTVQSIAHWVTGLPLREPASHSSPASKRPFPQAGAAEDRDDDTAEEEMADDDSSLPREEKEEDSSLLETDEEMAAREEEDDDPREKNAIDEALREAAEKTQSGKTITPLERTDDTEDAALEKAAAPETADDEKADDEAVDFAEEAAEDEATSVRHSAEHPSPFFVFPSSHCSPGFTFLSPQMGAQMSK